MKPFASFDVGQQGMIKGILVLHIVRIECESSIRPRKTTRVTIVSLTDALAPESQAAITHPRESNEISGIEQQDLR